MSNRRAVQEMPPGVALSATGLSQFVRIFFCGLLIFCSVALSASARPCTYTLSSNSASYSASGGSGSFTVTVTGTGCSWTAATTFGWLHTTNSGTVTGTVTYTVDGNGSTSSRSGTITAGGQTFTVTQS